jgi:hypothetical protein
VLHRRQQQDVATSSLPLHSASAEHLPLSGAHSNTHTVSLSPPPPNSTSSREGYADGLSSTHRALPASAFLLSDAPVEMLGAATRLVLLGPGAEEAPPGDNDTADDVTFLLCWMTPTGRADTVPSLFHHFSHAAPHLLFLPPHHMPSCMMCRPRWGSCRRSCWRRPGRPCCRHPCPQGD